MSLLVLTNTLTVPMLALTNIPSRLKLLHRNLNPDLRLRQKPLTHTIVEQNISLLEMEPRQKFRQYYGRLVFIG